MILQALVDHYEDLVQRGAIAEPGWTAARVSLALYLDDAGHITHVVPTMNEEQRGNKTVLLPRSMQVPAQFKRSSGIQPNFLCDHSGYFLGVDSNGVSGRTRDCFLACKELHQKILSSVDHPAARAVCRFFDLWDPDTAKDHSVIMEHWENLIAGGNLVFVYQGQFVQEIPSVGAAWVQYYLNLVKGPGMICLVTGRKGPVEAVHPSIKGIRGAQSSGAALVSFNAEAFTSYGKEQNYNAPVSKYAAFAYTTALNHLIADHKHICYVGDTAVLCWAEGADPAYQGLALGLLDSPQNYSETDLLDKVKHLLQGDCVEFEDSRLDPNRPFYMLGLSPNAARISVRFFWKNTFGLYIKHIMAHQQRMEIVGYKNNAFPVMPLWKLLGETVNQKSRDKTPSPVMAGEVLRAILQDGHYPATLLNNVNLRIRAEHQITMGRASIIKAYYLKNNHPDVPKEVLQVSLNKDSTNIPYNLGRLFSILENIQLAANPGINATIKDKYFNSASATPATVFPVLINLAQKHLRKIGGGLQVVLDRNLQEIMDKIGEAFPARMNLAQQGAFQLGYYQQTQARSYGKKKEEA